MFTFTLINATILLLVPDHAPSADKQAQLANGQTWTPPVQQVVLANWPIHIEILNGPYYQRSLAISLPATANTSTDNSRSPCPQRITSCPQRITIDPWSSCQNGIYYCPQSSISLIDLVMGRCSTIVISLGEFTPVPGIYSDNLIGSFWLPPPEKVILRETTFSEKYGLDVETVAQPDTEIADLQADLRQFAQTSHMRLDPEGPTWETPCMHKHPLYKMNWNEQLVLRWDGDCEFCFGGTLSSQEVMKSKGSFTYCRSFVPEYSH